MVATSLSVRYWDVRCDISEVTGSHAVINGMSYEPDLELAFAALGSHPVTAEISLARRLCILHRAGAPLDEDLVTGQFPTRDHPWFHLLWDLSEGDLGRRTQLVLMGEGEQTGFDEWFDNVSAHGRTLPIRKVAYHETVDTLAVILRVLPKDDLFIERFTAIEDGVEGWESIARNILAGQIMTSEQSDMFVNRPFLSESIAYLIAKRHPLTPQARLRLQGRGERRLLAVLDNSRRMSTFASGGHS